MRDVLLIDLEKRRSEIGRAEMNQAAEYVDERPKKQLGGLTPTQYAEQLKKKSTDKAATVQPGL